MPLLSALLRSLGLALVLTLGGVVSLSAAEAAVAAPALATQVAADAQDASATAAAAEPLADAEHAASGAHADDEAHTDDGHSSTPPAWSVIPFVVLLLCIAACPLLVPHFWHHHFAKVAIALGLITGIYYAAVRHDYAALVHAGFEYFSFIALLSGLFIASGGIVIKVNRKGTPMVNVIILLFGSVIANLVGTTGAAMLLIRPFMRVNEGRLKPYHIIFFIFMVANCGGALTPIGDPPLFLGFLKGIDFFLFMQLNWNEWILCLVLLAAMFYVIDMCNGPAEGLETVDPTGPAVSVAGGKSFVFLAVVVGAVFLDPSKLSFLPAIADVHHGEAYYFGIQSNLAEMLATKYPGLGSNQVSYFGFVREVIQIGAGVLAFKMADKSKLEANGFNFEPIKEVGYLFIGIFLTMQPALAIIKEQAISGSLFGLPLNTSTFYFGTGMLSGLLDNAPTFLSFLAGMEGKVGMTASQISEAIQAGTLSPEIQQMLVTDFSARLASVTAQMHAVTDPATLDVLKSQADGYAASLSLIQEGEGSKNWVLELAEMLNAIGIASVFWGAFTYIGNGPNFMVKAIAEASRDERGEPVVRCPSFFGYVLKFAIPFLLPVLLINWLVAYSPWSIM
ncbi:MAG: sodium:proton antiporter [Planctomycetota bacterium]|nr:sodium:proton antiporter [Planctomycetota bacterium]